MSETKSFQYKGQIIRYFVFIDFFSVAPKLLCREDVQGFRKPFERFAGGPTLRSCLRIRRNRHSFCRCGAVCRRILLLWLCPKVLRSWLYPFFKLVHKVCFPYFFGRRASLFFFSLCGHSTKLSKGPTTYFIYLTSISLPS